MLNAKSGPRIRHALPEDASYEALTLDPLTPVIGAEVAGIDLSQALSPRQEVEIRRALAEHLVIFFRDHISRRRSIWPWTTFRQPASSSCGTA